MSSLRGLFWNGLLATLLLAGCVQNGGEPIDRDHEGAGGARGPRGARGPVTGGGGAGGGVGTGGELGTGGEVGMGGEADAGGEVGAGGALRHLQQQIIDEQEALIDSTAEHCERCGVRAENELCDELEIYLPSDEELTCIIENSAAEELEELYESFRCTGGVYEELERCLAEDLRCDAERTSACLDALWLASDDCMRPLRRYNERLEELCFEAFERFACGDGEELPFELVCDGIVDCANGEDERLCEMPQPLPEEGSSYLYISDYSYELDERGIDPAGADICSVTLECDGVSELLFVEAFEPGTGASPAFLDPFAALSSAVECSFDIPGSLVALGLDGLLVLATERPLRGGCTISVNEHVGPITESYSVELCYEPTGFDCAEVAADLETGGQGFLEF